MINIPLGMSGEFRIQRYTDGVMDYDTGWFSNLIVDTGLLLCTTQPQWFQYTYIGSSASAPTVGDTQMGALLFASDTEPTANVQINNGAPNYEWSETVVRRFEAGEGTGTIAEVGIGYNTTSINGLFARHNVTPAITKNAQQVLDVSYRLTLWPPLGDLAGTMTLTDIDSGGSTPRTYDTTTRMLNIDATNKDVFVQFGPKGQISGNWNTYDGALGAITASSPLGDSGSGFVDLTWLASASGSRTFTNELNLNNGNAPLGVQTATGYTNHDLRFQTQYIEQGTGNFIEKDDTKTLKLEWTLTWARK